MNITEPRTPASKPTALRESALGRLHPDVQVPSYDRRAVQVGTVHIGVGGFHRAHQAVFLDDLFEAGHDLNWGICGVGLLPADLAMRDALRQQDCLYTVLVKRADGTVQPRVVGSLVEYLYGPDDPEDVLNRMTRPATRIVSLTITEGGYHVDPRTGAFDPRDPAVLADASGQAPPATAVGLLFEALLRRRAAGTAPFTVVSCDNLPGNGDLTRQMLTGYAALRDPGAAAWLRDLACPNTMVDRITPVTSEADIALLREQFALEDLWPVVCEDFSQWVLEDHFPSGRPAWEAVGAQLADDVEPYELMKLRLLNASHQALAYAGYLAGYRQVHEAALDPVIAEFVMGYMDYEATPTLTPPPGTDLNAYKHKLMERFSNPFVDDTLARLCAYSSDRIREWLLPVLRANLASGGDIRRATAVVACWARYAEGQDEQGRPIEVVDRHRDAVMAAAARTQGRPLSFLDNTTVFGELRQDQAFTDLFLATLGDVRGVGARRAVDNVNAATRISRRPAMSPVPPDDGLRATTPPPEPR